MTNTSSRVLIVGGGPAGACTAFFLAKAGFQVTVAERSTSKFAYGQGVDITGPAVEIVKKMGLYEKITANTTGERGSAIANDSGEVVAAIGASPEDASTASWTQEIEIMRGDITKIFAEAASGFPNVTYRYGCTVSDIKQGDGTVTAVLSDSQQPEAFAVIIGADGQGSRVRSMTFDPALTQDCIDNKDVYAGFFSMPGDKEHDAPDSRLQNAGGGRSIFIRPIDPEVTRSSCYVMCVGEHENLRQVSEHGHSIEEQKATVLDVIHDVPGLGERARQALREDARDFYFTRIVQIKLDTWHQGRVALVGDAGYAPSPLTGQGTTLAILGAYVLAGELVSNPNDPAAAFVEYEKRLQKYVEREQKIPLWGRAPKVGNPQSRAGVLANRTLFWALAKSQVWKLVNVGTDEEFPLPDYTFQAK